MADTFEAHEKAFKDYIKTFGVLQERYEGAQNGIYYRGFSVLLDDQVKSEFIDQMRKMIAEAEKKVNLPNIISVSSIKAWSKKLLF